MFIDVRWRSLPSGFAIFSKNWVVRYRIKLFGPAFTFVWQGLQRSDFRKQPEIGAAVDLSTPNEFGEECSLERR